MTDHVYVEVCEDCAMLLANGGGDSVEPSWCPDPCNNDPTSRGYCGGTCEAAAEAHAEAVWSRYGARNLHIVLDCNPESCEVFSGFSCEGCGSRLGGSRHRAAYWPDGIDG